MKRIPTIVLLLAPLMLFAQVGIGTTNPEAQLDIKASTTGIPALCLNAQSAPVGTTTGQLAVIGDKLYMYDATRGKWLSIESTLLNFGLEDGSDNEELEYVGDIEHSGPRMPLAGTIVYVSMNASGGQLNKSIQIYKNDVAVPDNADTTVDGVLTLDNSYSYINTQYNLDFNAGDHFRVEVTDAGGLVQDISVLLWVKWRQ